MIFFNEKRLRKIRIIFDIENWLWKSNVDTIFYTSPLTQFSKFNNFLWVCWFLSKNLSNFLPPVWKLHYPYCHNLHGKINSSAVLLYSLKSPLKITIFKRFPQARRFFKAFVYLFMIKRNKSIHLLKKIMPKRHNRKFWKIV